MSHRTKAVRAGEDSVERTMRRGLRSIGRKVAERVVDKVGHLLKTAADDAAAAAALNYAIEGTDWELLINPTEEQLRLVAQDGARRALLALGVTDEGITEQVFTEAAEWAKNRAAEMVGMRYNAAGDLVENPDAAMAITDATREELQTLVSDAISEGLSADELASAIEDATSFSAERALLIARTEIIRANNQGHLSSFRASGVVDQKAWSTAEDGDVCPECEANENQGPIPLDQSFESGDDAAPAHPNCRCVIVAVVEEQGKEEEVDEAA